MAERFRPVLLGRYFNADARFRGTRPKWSPYAQEQAGELLRGEQVVWGIPFRLGPADRARKGVIALSSSAGAVRVKLAGTATHICVLHFSDARPLATQGERMGAPVAEYALVYADGTEHAQVIRERFEIGSVRSPWGLAPFGAQREGMPHPLAAESRPWGRLQTGVGADGSAFASWVYALENPHPEKELAAIEFRPQAKTPAGVLGVTLYSGPGHPLRHVPRRVYRLLLPAEEKTKPSEFGAELDMGIVTRVFAAPGHVDEKWLKAQEAGLGATRTDDAPRREFLVEATGAPGAVLRVRAGEAVHEAPLAPVLEKGAGRSTDGKVRIELPYPRRTWVHVTVIDGSSGQPTPTRIHFRGKYGEYIAPYGHHEVVNDRWFEDYGGDLKLGGMSYAYVPGKFQIDLPVGEVYVEINKGFEYTPVRRQLEIRPGQRELTLRIDRFTDARRQGWVTADTHVHFISPDTAWLEGQGEGLNLINLLASQWGRLFTNVADISNAAAGCSREDTIVWVGTENRHHLLGHISLLGGTGDPVYPMCSGGPDEAYLGDPDYFTLTEWAEMCKAREGVVIRPHFPWPMCEEPVYIALGQLDGVELRTWWRHNPRTLDQFNYLEWYRYLNCGYRVAAVGGTDKMSAGMAVGSARTYALLDRDDEFTFENWGKAVRAGRTYTTTGALMDLQVDGKGMGEEVRLPAGGGTLEIRASAKSPWPLHWIEIVVNGQAVASSERKEGAKSLSVSKKVKLTRSSWIAARCLSRLPRYVSSTDLIGAHTSPVYVVVDNQEIFSPSDASYMLTLIDGGLTYLDTLSVRYDEARHKKVKAMFQRAQAALHARLHAHGEGHGHG